MGRGRTIALASGILVSACCLGIPLGALPANVALALIGASQQIEAMLEHIEEVDRQVAEHPVSDFVPIPAFVAPTKAPLNPKLVPAAWLRNPARLPSPKRGPTAHLLQGHRLLWSRQYAALDAWLESFVPLSIDSDGIAPLSRALSVFSAPTNTYEQVKHWRDTSPQSAWAHLIFGRMAWTRAYEVRGTSYSQHIPQSRSWEFDQLGKSAVRSFRRATQLAPHRVEAWISGFVAAGALGHRASERDRWLQGALKAAPRDLELHQRILHYAQPKWGGSISQLERLTETLFRDYGAEDPRFAWLMAQGYEYLADPLAKGGDAFADPEVRQRVSKALDAVEKAYPHSWKTLSWRTHLALAAGEKDAGERIYAPGYAYPTPAGRLAKMKNLAADHPDEALKAAIQLGRQGNLAACRYAATFMQNAPDPPKKDWKKIRRWYLRAAVTGGRNSTFWLAQTFLNKEAGPPDATLAYLWLDASARSGDPRAMAVLGDYFLNGWAVAKDPNQALRWYLLKNSHHGWKSGIAAAKLMMRNAQVPLNRDLATQLLRHGQAHKSQEAAQLLHELERAP